MRRAFLLLIAVACACGQRESRAVAKAPAEQRLDAVRVGPLPGLAEQNPDAFRNPFADDPDALRHGRRFFEQYNCAGCHGDHGGGGMGPSLRDERWLYGSSDAQVAKSIVDGRAHGMPAWGEMLTEAQVWQLAAYIKSLRTPHEPDPPPGAEPIAKGE